jgi:hypothetical protein
MQDYIEFKDYLCLSRSYGIKWIIEDNEQLFFSEKAIEIHFLKNKERNLLITNRAFYCLDGECK